MTRLGTEPRFPFFSSDQLLFFCCRPLFLLFFIRAGLWWFGVSVRTTLAQPTHNAVFFAALVSRKQQTKEEKDRDSCRGSNKRPKKNYIKRLTEKLFFYASHSKEMNKKKKSFPLSA